MKINRSAKKIKRGIISIICMLMMISFAACGEPEKMEISEPPVKMTLTSDFEKSSQAGLEFFYQSEDVIVGAFYENESDFENAMRKLDSVLDYVKAIIEYQGLPENTLISQNSGYYYYEYNRNVNGEADFSYMACAYNDNGKYWVITFACHADKYEEMKPQFLEWADTVTFE